MIDQDPSFYLDPYPVYARLRDEAPLHWSPGLNAWLVTRYDDVFAMLRDTEALSVHGRVQEFLGQCPAAHSLQPAICLHFDHAITHLDPPDHTRMRKLLSQVFSVSEIKGLRPAIEHRVRMLLDSLRERPKIDWIADFASPLPLFTLMHLLGIPEADVADFRRWSDDIGVRLFGTGQAILANIGMAHDSLRALWSYLGEVIAQRRMKPGRDLISRLLALQVDGDRLSDVELMSTCVTLVIAGHGTTTNLLGNGLWALLQEPQQLLLLRARPDLAPLAVEELLRFDAPIQRVWRRATRPFELHGQRIEGGQIVVPCIGAANRDPRKFDDADALRLDRRPNAHLAFGSGSHLCLGAPLARLQAAVALPMVLSAFSQIDVQTTSPEWDANFFHRGLRRLDLELTACSR